MTALRPLLIGSAAAACCVLVLAACGSDTQLAVELAPTQTAEAAPTETAPTETAPTETAPVATETADTPTPVAAATTTDGTTAGVGTTGVDIGLFFDGALAEEATTEDCTLSDGTEATCYRITVAGYPASHDVGPFCPSTLADDADAGGIWFDGSGVYDLSGQFFAELPTLYGDDNWKMHDDDGNILVTETAAEFEAAARPDVDPSLQNHCVEGRLEWLENGEPIPTTVLIPTEPSLAQNATAAGGNLGITLDGVVIAASAPVDAILSAYTIAAFDDCGAHFNPFEGYHMHGAVGCSEVGDAPDGDTPMFGYALDGYPVHSPLEAVDIDAAGLDECYGHTTEAGYHYHANNAAENQVITCLFGQTAASADTGARPGRGARPDGPRPEGEGAPPEGE